ncbi:MAG: dephospho-CoA kinase [Oligoflexia bacterium]|nr:dephospho-CoA kinase [Oligoflexia bacterium]
MKPRQSKKADAKAWGLTGGVASGKSTVAKFFAEEGFVVIDADQIARELSAPGGAAHDEIVQRFGSAESQALREIVFRDARARADLEAILHPKIRAIARRKFEEAGSAPVLYEAALLVETGSYRDFAGLITVSAPREKRIERLLNRPPKVVASSWKMTREMAEKIIDTQISDDEREAVATYVIHNDQGLESLHAQARLIARKIISG